MQEHEEHGTRGTLYTIMMVNQEDQPAELTRKYLKSQMQTWGLSYLVKGIPLKNKKLFSRHG